MNRPQKWISFNTPSGGDDRHFRELFMSSTVPAAEQEACPGALAFGYVFAAVVGFALGLGAAWLF
jgi:hypothetical protein